MFELQGQRAVITGAASGIGLAIAEIFASHQAQVFVIDLDAEKASEAAKSIAAKMVRNSSPVA